MKMNKKLWISSTFWNWLTNINTHWTICHFYFFQRLFVFFIQQTHQSACGIGLKRRGFGKSATDCFIPNFCNIYGGPRNVGQVKDGVAVSGSINPQSASINFAVPRVSIIKQYIINEFEIPAGDGSFYQSILFLR